MKKFQSIVLYAFSALLAGCAANLPPPPPPTGLTPAVPEPPEPVREERVPLETALQAARDNSLEIRTVESLQELAGEFMRNRLLFQLPGRIAETRAGSPPPVELQLQFLDLAISYNHLLGQSGETDLLPIRAERERQLLECENAMLWSRLDALRKEAELLPSPELDRQISRIRLELRFNTGWDERDLDRFDFDTLEKPRPALFSRDALREYAVRQRSETRLYRFPSRLTERFLEQCGHAPESELLLTEGLLRLPGKLEALHLTDPGAATARLRQLGSALGVTLQIDLDLKELRHAVEAMEHARLADAATPGNSAAQIAATRAELAWRLAWYRLVCDAAAPDFRFAPEHVDPAGSAPLPQETEELLRLLAPESAEPEVSSTGQSIH